MEKRAVLPKTMARPIAARIKALSSMDVAERRSPQDIRAVCARLDQQRPGLIWAKRPLILLWPWQNCLFRNLTLPPLPAKDRFQALRWTLEEAIALPAKDLACSWRLAQEPQTEKHIYGVAMTRCTELEHWTKLLRSAGLKVCHVDFALAWYGRRWADMGDVLYSEKIFQREQTGPGQLLLALYRYGQLRTVSEEYAGKIEIERFLKTVKPGTIHDQGTKESITWVAGGRESQDTATLLRSLWPGQELADKEQRAETPPLAVLGLQVWRRASFVPLFGPRRVWSWQQKALAIWSLVLVFFSLGNILPLFEEAMELQSEIQYLEEQMEKDEITAWSQRVGTEQRSASADILEWLGTLDGAEGVSLQEINYEQGRSLEMRGRSQNGADFERFLQMLEVAGWPEPRYQSYRYGNDGLEWQVSAEADGGAEGGKGEPTNEETNVMP